MLEALSDQIRAGEPGALLLTGALMLFAALVLKSCVDSVLDPKTPAEPDFSDITITMTSSIISGGLDANSPYAMAILDQANDGIYVINNCAIDTGLNGYISKTGGGSLTGGSNYDYTTGALLSSLPYD